MVYFFCAVLGALITPCKIRIDKSMNNILADLKSNHTKAILKLGLPIMLGQLGVIIVGFVDNIMVGQYGTAELAASSFVNNFLNLAFILGMGFSYGLTPLVSGAVASNNGQLKTLLKSSMVLNLAVGILLTIVMGFFLWKVEWLAPPTELLPLIRPYYIIHLVSIIPLMAFNTYKQFSDGLGLTRIGMQAVLLSNVVNIVLNWLLIFGSWGCPELGLIGAGIGTLSARLFTLIYMMMAVNRRKKVKALFESTNSLTGGVSRKTIKRLFEIGAPSGIQMGLESGSFSIAVIMVGWLGATALAAHQVINTMSTLGFMVYYGLSAAVTIRVGHFYELRMPDSIRKTIRSGLLMHGIIAGTLIVFLLTFRHVIGYAFTKDEAVISLVATLCIPVCLYQVGDVLQILFSNALRGMQDVRFTAWAAFFCYTGLIVLVAYPLGFIFNLGVVGIWFAFPIGLTTLGVLLLLRYRKVLKRLESNTQESDHQATVLR